MSRYILCTSIFLILSFGFACAQQSSYLGQSADEFGSDNPAGLSLEEIRFPGIVFNVIARNQWWKLNAKGFPQTQMATWLDNTHPVHQFGAAAFHDQIGETRQIGLLGRYALTLDRRPEEGQIWRVGLSAGMISHRIYTENLDQYDDDDPLVALAAENRWRYVVGVGTFYSAYHPDRTLKWFAGVSARFHFLQRLELGSESIRENEILVQGGVGWKKLWTGARLRWSLERPDAIDLYARQYAFDRGEKVHNFFGGAIFTSDLKYRTAGLQFGYEREMQDEGIRGSYLIVNLGVSKPLSRYIAGDNLIFDARVTVALTRQPRRRRR